VKKVGGDMLDFFLTRLNRNAKIVVCGAISDYNKTRPQGIRNYTALIAMRATMQGFVVYVWFVPWSSVCIIQPKVLPHCLLTPGRALFDRFDYANEYPKARADIAKWIKAGKIKRKFHIEEGLENCPEYLKLLFNGGNDGKLCVSLYFFHLRLFLLPAPDQISALEIISILTDLYLILVTLHRLVKISKENPKL
jgi:NADPH:quinone reductase-like Zn-dependent oxidoreductase